jgi:hypothetical protein
MDWSVVIVCGFGIAVACAYQRKRKLRTYRVPAIVVYSPAAFLGVFAVNAFVGYSRAIPALKHPFKKNN